MWRRHKRGGADLGGSRRLEAGVRLVEHPAWKHTSGRCSRRACRRKRLSGIPDKRKDGSRGKLRIDYGDPKHPEKPIAWLWKFIDGAKTAGELYGRALVVIAAEQHACRLVVPSGQRFGAKRWLSHKDHAAKALQKLAGPHLPATLKQLEKAIAKAGAELHDAQEQASTERRSRVVAFRSQARSPMPAPSTTKRSRPRPRTNAKTSTTSSSTSRSRTTRSSMPTQQSDPAATETRTPRRRSSRW
jgi:hypothetical protein